MTDEQSYNGPGRPLETAADHVHGVPPQGAPDDLALAFQPLTDLGNGYRLRKRSGADLINTLERGWGVWCGEHWDFSDGQGRAEMKAHDMAAQIATEAKSLDAARKAGDVDVGLEGINALKVWARQSANNGKMKAALEVAAPYLRWKLVEFDARPDLLNLPGGTLELGVAGSPYDMVSLRPAERGDMITRRGGVAFDPEARAPQFEAFLERILPDYEVRQFLQRFFGYAITGDTGEQIMLLCFGRGANGKSVLLNILRAVFGDYALTLPFASLTDDHSRGGGDATPDLVRLPGARLVMASEPKVGARLSESTIKIMTGGEPMMVRPLYREPFEFVPVHKIVLSFNNKPKVIAQDEGTWRRLAMVPFEVTIPEDERDPFLADTIIAEEAGGVLNWVLAGVRMYRECGLAVPDQVREATSDYRGESDPIGPFIDAAVERVPGVQVSAARLYRGYETWCALNGVEAVKQTRFGRVMVERGFHKQKYAGLISYQDCDLTDEYHDRIDRASTRRPHDDAEPQEEPPI